MGPFARLKKLEFVYNDETIELQLQISDCFSFIRCRHMIFMHRFGHANIIVRDFEILFEQIEEADDDYDFFQALQGSAKEYLANFRV